MSLETPLTDLCSICYTEPPKYRCPRCKARTCSLTCSKRHKQRASCSGERNPAEYLKKSQIATPAGIDHDYNYLRNVERQIHAAGREMSDRGVGKRSDTKHHHQENDPKSSLSRYLTANRITVKHAPTGMTRQTANHTRCSYRKNIQWTIEWVDAQGNHELQHDNLESSTIAHLYEHMQREKANLIKRSANADEDSVRKHGKKRKRGDVTHESDQKDLATAIVPGSSSPSTTPAMLHVATSEQDQDTAEQVSLNILLPAKTYFYLLKPETTGKAKIVSIIDETSSLTDCLRNKTVLEYPTIFALPYAKSDLPTEFMLENEYQPVHGPDKQAAASSAKPSRYAGHTPLVPTVPEKTYDAKQILDMLKRDVTR